MYIHVFIELAIQQDGIIITRCYGVWKCFFLLLLNDTTLKTFGKFLLRTWLELLKLTIMFCIMNRYPTINGTRKIPKKLYF